MQYVLGIDLGTSYFKFGLFDRAGRLAGFSRVAAPKQGAAGRCELPIERFWETLSTGAGQAAAGAGTRPGDVAAVGYSSQANSFVLLDRADRAPDRAGGQRISLAPGTPFCVGTLDHHAAALGAGFGSLADVSLSMGTVLACLRPCATFRPTPGTIAGPGFAKDHFFQLAFCNAGAGMLEVYRDA